MSVRRNDTGGLPAGDQPITPELAEYWSGAARGVLLLPWCQNCDRCFWYPRPFCPWCGGRQLEWRESRGEGVVYSHTTVQRGDGAFGEAGPYVLAYVELAEAVRILTNLVGVDPARVRIGDEVRAEFQFSGSGQGILRFRPV